MNVDGGAHEIPLPDGCGRLWLCGKHLIGPDPDGVLDRLGADAVVCLVERDELADRYPDYVRWLADAPQERAVHLPVHDLSAPDLVSVMPLLERLVARLRDGESLVVHCGAGIGRAGTVAVALLVMLGVPLPAALDHVRAHRPMAGPEVGSQLALVHAVADLVAGFGSAASEVLPG